MRLPVALLASTTVAICGTGTLRAQTTWEPLVAAGGTRVGADSASWTRTGDSTWVVRLRTTQGLGDGRPSADATILRMEINCARRVFRIRQTSVERGGILGAPLPDSLGSSDWIGPEVGLFEDSIIRAVCKRAPGRTPLAGRRRK